MSKIFFEVDKDGWTGCFQLNITDGSAGYRLAGPKYNGSSTNVLRVEITERDAKVIRGCLDEAFPVKPADAEKQGE